MECGSQEFLCELTNWLSENEMVGPWLVEVIGRFGAQAQGIAGSTAQFVREYGQSIVGLIGVSFGFWRWWRYREHILHKRLAEYLRENDARLASGTADLIELIQRPAPGQQFKDPLFIDHDLRVVLRERNWDKSVFALSVETSSDWQLTRAIESIKRRISTAQRVTDSLHRQLSSANSVRGAIAASRGDRTRSGEYYRLALDFFRSALNVPGSERNIVLKELEAHQHRKLDLPTTTELYDQLFKHADSLDNERDRHLLKARSRRYSAEVAYPASSWNAWRMMTAAAEDAQYYPGALYLISKCQPLNAWETLEEADMHYFAALCADRNGYFVAAPAQLGAAESDYRSVLRGLPRLKWRRSHLRLRTKARAGLKRVKAAKSGDYDTNWLPS
jgi:hypothetical protein